MVYNENIKILRVITVNQLLMHNDKHLVTINESFFNFFDEFYVFKVENLKNYECQKSTEQTLHKDLLTLSKHLLMLCVTPLNLGIVI